MISIKIKREASVFLRRSTPETTPVGETIPGGGELLLSQAANVTERKGNR
jgi:hypothetical protein